MTDHANTPKRWRPWQFSLRLLLLLMFGAGCYFAGWTGNEQRRQREIEHERVSDDLFIDAVSDDLFGPDPSASQFAGDETASEQLSEADEASQNTRDQMLDDFLDELFKDG